MDGKKKNDDSVAIDIEKIIDSPTIRKKLYFEARLHGKCIERSRKNYKPILDPLETLFRNHEVSLDHVF